MGNDLPGKFIGILIAFVLCVIAPFVIISVQDEMLDRRLILNHVTDFIDEVVDSRKIDKADLEELNLNLSSYGITVDYQITRYVRSVNYDPNSTEGYSVNYILSDLPNDMGSFNKGDKISVHVYTVGYSSTTSLVHRLTGAFVRDLDETITARIR